MKKKLRLAIGVLCLIIIVSTLTYLMITSREARIGIIMGLGIVAVVLGALWGLSKQDKPTNP